jgi:hypothetical protein
MSEDSHQLVLDIFEFLRTKENVETKVILTGLSMVLATIVAEAGVEEEKAVYAFRKSISHAYRRMKQIAKGVH